MTSNFSTNLKNNNNNTFGKSEVSPQQRFLLYNTIITQKDINPYSLVNKVNTFISRNKLKVTFINNEQVTNELKKLYL